MTALVAGAAEDRSFKGATSDKALGALLCAAVKLYAGHASAPYGADALGQVKLSSPTEACTVAAALLRSQDLSPFEFCVWFSATETNKPES